MNEQRQNLKLPFANRGHADAQVCDSYDSCAIVLRSSARQPLRISIFVVSLASSFIDQLKEQNKTHTKKKVIRIIPLVVLTLFLIIIHQGAW